jgi:peptidoglycan/xylan/chitin deacetylase (PgdA/CDA1 family)
MLRQVLKNVYYAGASAIGLDSRVLRKLKADGKVAILNLHRISRDANAYWPPLRPEIFEELLKFLRSNFEVCAISDLGDAKSAKPLAVLSFDDGYYDFIEFALPLLRKYKMPANMNVIPQCAASGMPIWNVRLYDFLQGASVKQIHGLVIPGFVGKPLADNPDAKLDFGLRLSRYLKQRPRSEREEIWGAIEPYLSESASRTRMMTTAEIREVREVIELGAHSYSHESMAYEDDTFFQQDFAKCKEFFDSEINVPLSIYAFPNGSYRPEQVEFLSRSSVKHVLLVGEEFADPRSGVLHRLTMYGETAAEVKMRSLGL